jgi:hypothetical protein
MNIILTIFNPNDMVYFSDYSSLIEIISKVLCQFINVQVPAINSWLACNLLAIDNFFLSYAKGKKTMN